MNLFLNSTFTSHAGVRLPFKIECDALTDDDIAVLAEIIARHTVFSSVVSIPRGGDRLANALQEFVQDSGPVLIVDDVFTTGKSMEDMRRAIGGEPIGVVIFARGELPSWVKAVFTLSPWART